MKKTYITNIEGTFRLFRDIEGLYGDWLLETEEEPLTLSDLEDWGEQDQIDYFSEEILNDPATLWEECDEDDQKYVNKWLDIWGITALRRA